MWIVKNRKIFYNLSGILVILCLVAVVVWKLQFGIDFTGGSLLEIAYSAPGVTTEQVTTAVENAGVKGSSVRPTGDTGFIIRTPFLTPAEYATVSQNLTLNSANTFEEKHYDSIGPTIGTELQTKAIYAILLVLVAIALFIMFAFRKVSKPVSSWKYGLIALTALAHDVIIPIGAFAVMGHFYGVEVDTLFVTAVLVVLGFSVHDTIVVFDRVRENLRKNQEQNLREPFEDVVGKSIAQTLNRSINTSLTTVLALLALYFFGPAVTHYFVLALIIGIIAGTYSSIFLGSPLLVTLEKMQKPEEIKKKK